MRFTTKRDALYAFVMGQNARETQIAALAPSRGLEQRQVARVESSGKPWTSEMETYGRRVGHRPSATMGHLITL